MVGALSARINPWIEEAQMASGKMFSRVSVVLITSAVVGACGGERGLEVARVRQGAVEVEEDGAHGCPVPYPGRDSP
ncbi:MAG: hypothetical protein KY464_12595 [Gemmatimonadetes bacterium]|nr:hypothetical protein [Gemmatimonadota bacterium]